MTPFHSLMKRLDGDLFTDTFRRRLLSTDGSIFKEFPAAVAYPKQTRDVVEIINFARSHNLPVHGRGTGSGVCGGAIGRGIVVDFSKYMNRLLKFDKTNKYFECQPGYRMGELDVSLAGTGLFFPPDPSSGEYASFGGMYATNASGAHSVKYGNVGDYCIDAQIVTADGEVIQISEVAATTPENLEQNLADLLALYTDNQERIEAAYPPVRYNSTGYNLRQLAGTDGRLNLTKLFAGAEGTLGLVTRLTFKLIEKPPFDILIVAYFDDIVTSAKATQKILPLGPCGIEIMDKSLLNLARQRDRELDRMLPDAIDNLLLIAFDEAEASQCREKADATKKILGEVMAPTTGNETCDQADNKIAQGRVHVAFSKEEKLSYWSIRKAAVPILYKMKGEKKVLALIEDATVPTDQLVPYFEGIYQILDELEVQFVLFGHIAKGLLHTRPMLNLKDPDDVAKLDTVSDRIFELVRSLDGAISGEHGDGRLRSVYIKDQYPDIYPLFRQAKAILDPARLLNPDLLTGATKDRFSALRYGPEYQAGNPYSPMVFGTGDLMPEIEKCHGCSKCTTVTHATRMCPVYKVLRDEAAAPKAKANILRSLIDGSFSSGPDTVPLSREMQKTAYAKGLFHVLDHCINCGSCSHECPSGVNIPRMVMEAKANFKHRFGASISDHLLTSAEAGAMIASPLSGIAAPAMKNKKLRQLMEKATGISARRTIDPFASQSLKKRVPKISGSGQESVLYFAGCYASHIRPEIGEAALYVLKAAGFNVVVPDQHCCGLPMTTKGMGSKALATVRKNIKKWAEAAQGAKYIVTTCSSCLLSLTEYWPWFLDSGMIKKNSADSRMVLSVAAKTRHISRVLTNRLPDMDRNAGHGISIAYHTPCHLKATPDPGASVKLLGQIPGVQLDPLTTHCCGMAGTWGMMAEHYELSNRIGADLKNKLKNSPGAWAATDCPTCRMQMESFSDKPVFHPVEILARILNLRTYRPE